MNQNLVRTVWIVVVAIMAMGLIALYSASYNNVRVPHTVFYDQLIFAVLGLGLYDEHHKH